MFSRCSPAATRAELTEDHLALEQEPFQRERIRLPRIHPIFCRPLVEHHRQRSWISAIAAFAAQVTIVKVISERTFSGYQDSYRPAKSIRPPARGWIQSGWRLAFGPVHSWNPSAGTIQRRCKNASRNVARCSSVSALALMHPAGPIAVPRRPIHQTPAGALRLLALEFRSDDEVLIGRRNIEARPIAGRHAAFILDTKRLDDLPPLHVRVNLRTSIRPRSLGLRAQPRLGPCLRAARQTWNWRR